MTELKGSAVPHAPTSTFNAGATAHPTDVAFRYLSTDTTPQNIACLATLDRAPDEAALRLRAAKVSGFFPRMRQRFQPGKKRGYIWTPSQNFRLDDHLSFFTLEGPPSAESLSELIRNQFVKELSLERPLWRLIVINHGGANPNNPAEQACALLVFHHSVTDGLGGMEILNSLTSPNDPEVSRHRTERKRTSPKQLRWSWPVFLSAVRTVKGMLSHKPPKLFSGTNSPHREIAVVTTPLATLRAIRKLYGGSMNEAFLFLICGTVARYAEYRGSANLTDPVAIVPISLRPLSARNELGNFLTGVGLPLPAMMTDAQRRMNIIRTRSLALKDPLSVGSYSLISEFGVRLPRFLQPLFFRTLAKTTSFICTNVPESARPDSLAGAVVLQKYGLPALMKGHGLGFALITYAQQACLAAVSDPAILRDAEKIKQFLEEEIDKINLEFRSALHLREADHASAE